MNLGSTLLGIPLVFWGIGCLAVAVAYYRIWPQPSPKRTQRRTQWQHIVLRYFHALVWVLLAAGCFLAGAGYNIGLWVAALALPVYIYFLVMVVQDRNRELADLAAQRKAQAAVPATVTGAGSSSSRAAATASASAAAANGAPASADKPEIKRPSGSVSK